MTQYNGLKFKRHFTKEGENPFGLGTKIVRAEIKDKAGKIIYQRDNLEFPKEWSSKTVDIVASKYFKEKIGEKYGNHERSVKQLVSRVVDTITEQGIKQGYFNKQNSRIFNNELSELMLKQYASFNSPVWFNVGLNQKYDMVGDPDETYHYAWDERRKKPINEINIYERPQIAACFISSIEDNMNSILDFGKKEGMLFKFGSGNGANFSALRGCKEPLIKGGVASGGLYFMIFYDQIAKSIKSGGKTRRAAKMVILNDNHPDAIRFVKWKSREELKAKVLQIFDKYGPQNPSDLDDEAHFTVTGQNSNNSIRISDKFMLAYMKDKEWELINVTAKQDNSPEKEISLDEYKDDRFYPDKEFLTRVTTKRKFLKARTLMDIIAEEAVNTGDPGVQFDDTINDWNTCANSGRINATNPCSEYIFLDNTSCNLASLNINKFKKEDGSFDIKSFQEATKLLITAQEILVDFGSYPGKEVAQKSHDFRPLGLGYANLGAFLMEQGTSYNSDEGRLMASAITSLLTGTAYNQSAKLARIKGAFPRFEENKEPFMKVMYKHKTATDRLTAKEGLEKIIDSAKKEWAKVVNQKYFRNAQASVIAPTGTIGFMMGVDTTGIEPLAGLDIDKSLSGGGSIKLEAECFEKGLEKLGYNESEIESIKKHVTKKKTVIGSIVKEEHIPIFATAYDPENSLNLDAHIKMLASVQPFVSGGISKTVTLPPGSTKQDMINTYTKAWELGLKSVATYVSGSKGKVQPLQVSREDIKESSKWGERKRLLDDRTIYVNKFKVRIGETPVHIIISEFEETLMPGEIFLNFGGAGSTYTAAYASLTKAISGSLQHGTPIEDFVKHNLGAKGSIEGMTSHPYIRQCSSLEDFLAKYIAGNYLEDTSSWNVKPEKGEEGMLRINFLKRLKKFVQVDQLVNPKYYPKKEKAPEKRESSIFLIDKICSACGNLMSPEGANCFVCKNCAQNTGCGGG